MAIKSTGIVRKVDELGRIVLPKELRKARNIEHKDYMEIYMEDGGIILKRCSPDEIESLGIVRRVDELGRIVLPKETRAVLKILHKDSLEIYVDEDKIILKKYQPACIFCENAENLVDFCGKKVCKDCAAKIAEL